MESLEKQYYWYLENTSEESRREDEGFIEIQMRYAEELKEERLWELRELFGETSQGFD